MSKNTHLLTLKQKHDNLERSIKIANSQYQDELTIKTLKKQKLLLKDKILKIESQ